MSLEVLLFYVEVIYLWRALPFCSADVKRQLLEKLSGPLPTGAQPVHQAMRAWLRGGLLNSLDQPIEAEKVGGMRGFSLSQQLYGLLLHQSLHEALRFDGVIRNDKHILSFSLFELAMIHISRDEVCVCVLCTCVYSVYMGQPVPLPMLIFYPVVC